MSTSKKITIDTENKIYAEAYRFELNTMSGECLARVHTDGRLEVFRLPGDGEVLRMLEVIGGFYDVQDKKVDPEKGEGKACGLVIHV